MWVKILREATPAPGCAGLLRSPVSAIRSGGGGLFVGLLHFTRPVAVRHLVAVSDVAGAFHHHHDDAANRERQQHGPVKNDDGPAEIVNHLEPAGVCGAGFKWLTIS